MMQKNTFQIFTTPLFLFCLLLLLCNDWLWKAEYGNFWTGKISDFAGLAIFPLFFAAFFPRFKKHIFVWTAIVFLWWKSPFSQFFIEGWNNVMFFSLARVVDYTDLWALLVLPFAYRYRSKSLLSFSSFAVPKIAVKSLTFFVIGASCIAFMATSIPRNFQQMKITYNETYLFPYSKSELQNRIFDLYKKYEIDAYMELPEATRYGNYVDMEREKFIEVYLQDTAYLDFKTQNLIIPLMLPDINSNIVQVIIEGNDVTSTLELNFLTEYRNVALTDKTTAKKSKDSYHRKMLRKFEKRVIKKLRE